MLNYIFKNATNARINLLVHSWHKLSFSLLKRKCVLIKFPNTKIFVNSIIYFSKIFEDVKIEEKIGCRIAKTSSTQLPSSSFTKSALRRRKNKIYNFP